MFQQWWWEDDSSQLIKKYLVVRRLKSEKIDTRKVLKEYWLQEALSTVIVPYTSLKIPDIKEYLMSLSFPAGGLVVKNPSPNRRHEFNTLSQERSLEKEMPENHQYSCLGSRGISAGYSP